MAVKGIEGAAAVARTALPAAVHSPTSLLLVALKRNEGMKNPAPEQTAALSTIPPRAAMGGPVLQTQILA
jgi:hypothetical protein